MKINGLILSVFICAHAILMLPALAQSDALTANETNKKAISIQAISAQEKSAQDKSEQDDSDKLAESGAQAIALDFQFEQEIYFDGNGDKLFLAGQAKKGGDADSSYFAGLYLVADEQYSVAPINPLQILLDDQPKRFSLYCQGAGLEAGTLNRALNLGFIGNLSEAELILFEKEIAQLNKILDSHLSPGVQIWFDYIPAKGMLISIEGVQLGLIGGKAFFDAFLKVWIGANPINASIKKQLLNSPNLNRAK